MTGFKEYKIEYDVIIVGGGMTGLCAALASARHGVRTALVQDRPVLGGNASSEIRMHICGASANMKKPDLCEGGIVHELMLANKRVNDSYNFSIWDSVLLDAAKREKNLTLYLNTTMHAAVCEEGVVRRIVCYQMTTEKRFELSAKIFADCTGNGTLGAFIGAEYHTGSEAKSEYHEPHAPETANADRMGNTLLFKAANVGHPVKFTPPIDAYHFTEEQLKYRKHSQEIPEQVLKKATKEEIWMLFDGYCQDYGYWWIEIPGVSDDIISEYEDIRDQLVRAVYGVWDHIKNGGDHGAENYELVWVGMLPGVRESRRMMGDYVLNENDVLESRNFEDAVAYGGWHIDNHVPGGLFSFDKIPSFVHEVPGVYTIPYRAYCAKGFQNLYIAGRCMSASKLAMASARVMGTCAIGGQAVGTAAAMCIQRGLKDIRELALHMEDLQQSLLRDDCFIPGIVNLDRGDLARMAGVSASSAQPGYPPENAVNGISRALDGNSNAWRSAGLSQSGEWLDFKLHRPARVHQVQLTFDSNFSLEKKITLSSRRQRQQVPGVPPELVKDCTVELFLSGERVAVESIADNYLRMRRVDFSDVLCDEVRLNSLSTNGVEEARVFEVRIYE